MSKVSDLLADGRTYSFEFFPPKTDAEQARLVQTLMELQPLRPSFVSVTYRGGPSSRQRTTDIVVSMLRLTTLNPMAHLTCSGHSRLELADILVSFRKAGVENLMALAGDPPSDPSVPPGELDYALELVELARAIGGFLHWCRRPPDGSPPVAQHGHRPPVPGRQVAGRRFCRYAVLFRTGGLFLPGCGRGGRGPLTNRCSPASFPSRACHHYPASRRWVAPSRAGWPSGWRLRVHGAARVTWPRPGWKQLPSCAPNCWTRGPRASTSTLSTGPRRPGRSTPTSAFRSVGDCRVERPAPRAGLARQRNRAAPSRAR